jgi:hypothetical protein
MGIIMTLYAAAFSYFFTGFHEFLHKHLFINLQIFHTGFFEDDIHYT